VVTVVIGICSFIVVIAAGIRYFLDIVDMIATLKCSYLAYFQH